MNNHPVTRSKGLILVMNYETYAYVKIAMDHLSVNNALYANMKIWLDSALRNYSSDGEWSIWNWPVFQWENVLYKDYETWEALFHHLVHRNPCYKLKYKLLCKEKDAYVELGNTNEGPYNASTVDKCTYTKNTYAAPYLNKWTIKYKETIKLNVSLGIDAQIILDFEKRKREHCLIL